VLVVRGAGTPQGAGAGRLRRPAQGTARISEVAAVAGRVVQVVGVHPGITSSRGHPLRRQCRQARIVPALCPPLGVTGTSGRYR
jgi:hypothetical protein